ncbi:hypothetical protein [Lentibacillus sp. CBA3610]|uniref:hypothetical protein n=1 Tax=Lentibacillus sp. CBA3610 TaxID=2518176 RepID=UPI0015958595|nr:hypothetical protein [Lentibacillus sp. CBA3610]QKY68380.1 hypothetical protein Len3610_00950 [Lentibacillus sp. CBA3610]
MKKPWYKKIWVWVVAVIIIIAIGTVNSDDVEEDEAAAETDATETTEDNDTDTSGNTDETDTTETNTSEADTEVEETDESTEENVEEETVEETPQEKALREVVELMDEGLAFDTGSYVEGDIPEGEYAFIPFDGSGKYYSETDSAGNIIDNENFDSFGYVYVHGAANLETHGVLVSVDAFEELNVSGAKELYEQMNGAEDYKESGMYKIGDDIEPNQYTIESMGEGYTAILSGPVGDNEIVDNNIFNGKYNVNVSDGQYLKVSKGKLAD